MKFWTNIINAAQSACEQAKGLRNALARVALPKGFMPLSTIVTDKPLGAYGAAAAGPSGKAATKRSLRSLAGRAAILLILSLMAPAAALGFTPPGTNINNSATATYDVGAVTGITSTSNISTVTTIVHRTPSTIQFLAYAPAPATGTSYNVAQGQYSPSGSLSGPFSPLNDPSSSLSGGPIAVPAAVTLAQTDTFHAGEPVFIMITDNDQNIDPFTVETLSATVTSGTGDSEVLLFTETGPDTGIFIAYVQSTTAVVSANNGLLSIVQGGTITATYTDSSDGTDSSADAGLIDPYGIVFDSVTGAPIDGAIIQIINAGNGSPAAVFGDDGISAFPSPAIYGASTVVSGDQTGNLKDAGGSTYLLPAGMYRFPLVAPGTYYFIITPPPGYIAPSVITTQYVNFTVVAGSHGGPSDPFVINPGPAMHIDIPLDPLMGAGLFTGKTAAKATAGIGEFVQYSITVTNATPAPLTNVAVTDTLPLGLSYESGSATLDNATAADPVVSADGLTLTFNIPALAPGATAKITYVTFIGAGVKPGIVKNTAVAASGSLVSNVASASIKVVDDLAGRSTIVGRVFPYGCGEPTDEVGIAGVKIFLEDGTFAVTDKNGMYHFEGVKPGTHVVQADVSSLPPNYELAPCVENTRHAGRSFSQFVDLQQGTLWRADFYAKLKDRIKGQASLSLSSALSGSSINYTLKAVAAEVPLSKVSITVLLPDETDFTVGSASINGTPVEPRVMNGAVVFNVAALKASEETLIKFSARILDPSKERDFDTSTVMSFSTPAVSNQKTPVVKNILSRISNEVLEKGKEYVLRPHFPVLSAELQDIDKTALDKLIKEYKGHTVTHIYAEGHTDSTPIAAKNRHIYADNTALSNARAKSVADYLAAAFGIDSGAVTITGKGSAEPLTNNKDVAGRAKNRRVELKIVSDKVVSGGTIDKKALDSASANLATEGQRHGEDKLVFEAEELDIIKEMDKFEAMYKSVMPEGRTPEFEWLWPTDKDMPIIPSINISIKHAFEHKVVLYLDGVEVDKLSLEEKVKDSTDKVAISRWRGVDLLPGNNIFTAKLVNKEGAVLAEISHTVRYAGTPVRYELVKEQTRLVADGKTPPIVAVRLFDKDDTPARMGVKGRFAINPPYEWLYKVRDIERNPISGGGLNLPEYVVGKDGIALIKLAPTTTTGEADITLHFANGNESVKAWVSPDNRDWILVGFAEGTLAHDTINKNVNTSKAAGEKDGYYEDGTLAFYAKGTVKGEYLLTIAYDSRRGRQYDPTSLHGIIDPGTYYTVYGDGSTERYDAASSRALYVKIEREKFYALFGDFDTGMTVTELSRYSRSYNGLKSEYKGEKYSYTAFATDTNQAFVKDELRGDGTSGPYSLSRTNIVMNTDKVRIEVRDRFRSEIILKTSYMSGHVDYDIDYDASTLFFKKPVPSVDEDLNPVYIVAEYESYDDSDKEYNFGGRASVKHDNGIETGATYVHEGRVGAKANLYGVDATVPLTEKTKLKAEAARTSREFGASTVWGSAGLAEVTHIDGKLKSKAYIREEDASFGIGHQAGSEGGLRKLGVEGSYDLSSKIRLNARAYEENNRTTDADRYVIETGGRLLGQGHSIEAGVLDTTEKYATGDDFRSTQFKLGGTKSFLNSRVSLNAKHEQSIVSNNEAPNHPTRTTLGAEYKITKSVTLFATQELAYGSDESSNTAAIGLKASPWKGAAMSSSMTQNINENGSRVMSNVGLSQTLNFKSKWTADAAIEHANTMHHNGSPQFNLNAPKASGGDDFVAISLGLAYTELKWGWSSRLEFRNSDTEDKQSFLIGAFGEPRDGIGLSAALKLFKSDTAAGIDKRSEGIRLGFAYRPRVTRLIILDRLDLERESVDGSTADYDNRKIVNRLNLNYKHDSRNEASLIYAAKYVRDTIASNSYTGFTDFMGLEGRHDINAKFDIGLYTGVLHSWHSGQYNYRFGASLGYNLMQNAWISVGYNFKGFRDEDFSKADFTSKGTFIKLRLKFDQETAKDAVRWFTGQ